MPLEAILGILRYILSYNTVKWLKSAFLGVVGVYYEAFYVGKCGTKVYN